MMVNNEMREDETRTHTHKEMFLSQLTIYIVGQVKPGGGLIPQMARSSKAKGIAMLRLRSLSLMVVQRHNAASISRTPCNTGQHLLTEGSPRPRCTNPPKTSTHAPNLRASRGHVPEVGGVAGVVGGTMGVVGVVGGTMGVVGALGGDMTGTVGGGLRAGGQ